MSRTTQASTAAMTWAGHAPTDDDPLDRLRIDAPFAPTQAKRKHLLRKFTWLLVGLIMWATATTSGYAQAWRYHPKKSWEHHPKNSWKYHPKNSWKYHPKQKQRLVAVDQWSRPGFDGAAGAAE